MLYHIRHITRYRYSAPIRESIMEARMQPRSDGNQRCLEFRLEVAPRARPSCYQDHLENTVHHFDIPGEHQQLFLLAESTVDVKPIIGLPDRLPHEAWREIDDLFFDGIFWDLLQPSTLVQNTPLVEEVSVLLGVNRSEDPRRSRCYSTPSARQRRVPAGS